MSEKTCGKNADGISCRWWIEMPQGEEGTCPFDKYYVRRITVEGCPPDNGHYEPYPPPVLFNTLGFIGDEAEVEVNGVWMTPGAGKMARKATRRFTKENSDG